MTEMYLAGLTVDLARSCPLVILTDAERQRALPIYISPPDAVALGITIGESKPVRPLTHDLLQDIIEKMGFNVKCVELNELSGGTLYAVIKLYSRDPAQSNEEISLDARPSDAIALALRFHAPIYVSLEIVAAATVPTDIDKDKDEAENFRDFVDNLKASDFNNRLAS
jgi:bifunctional DNase/RNase